MSIVQFERIRRWAQDRNLIDGSDPFRQSVKLFEELGELAAGVARNRPEAIKDGIGDAVVVLTILAAQHGMTIEDCIEAAWHQLAGEALQNAAYGLRRIVEEIDGAMKHGTWRGDIDGVRLKDTPEWVAFYNAMSLRSLPPQDGEKAALPLIADYLRAPNMDAKREIDERARVWIDGHQDPWVAALSARAEKAEAERDAVIEAGRKFHSACVSAWAAGEPSHKVVKMLDEADAFAAVLDQPAQPVAQEPRPVGHNDMVEAFMAGAFSVHEEWLRAHAASEAPPRGDPEFREAATDHADTYAARYLAHPATPAPVEAGLEALIEAAKFEAAQAMKKFPQPNYVISKVAEEAGEVVKAAIHCAEGRETPENVIGEIKQAMAMLIRLYIEGDQVHGLPPLRAQSAPVGGEVKG